MRLPTTMLGLALTLLAPVAQAQSRAIVFTNVGNLQVPLRDGSELEILADGTVRAECVLDGEICAGLGASGPAPTVMLVASASEIAAGAAVSLSWNVVNGSPGACIASSTPAVANWHGIALPPLAGSRVFTLASAGSYQFGLTCYSEFGSGSASVAVTVVEAPPPPGSCTASGPGIEPAGYTRVDRSWAQVFNGLPATSTPAFPMPVGSYTQQGASVTGTYFTVPFQLPAGSTRTLQWAMAQPVGALGYVPQAVANTALVSISPCGGDLRAPQAGPDPLLSQCRGLGPEGQVVFGTAGSGCPLTPGTTYFLNVLLDDPHTLTPGSSACSSGSVCDILVQVPP